MMQLAFKASLSQQVLDRKLRCIILMALLMRRRVSVHILRGDRGFALNALRSYEVIKRMR